MRFSIFKKNADGTMSTEEFDFEQPESSGYKMPYAHCDQTILHAPGVCQFCDHFPEAQALRAWWRINFTGESDPNKAPCPSEYFRTGELRDRWPGNTAGGFL